MGMNNCFFTFFTELGYASVHGHEPWSHDMAGKAKYFSYAASKYHNKSGKNSSTLPVIFLVFRDM
jgi:hypothetical protein